MYRDTLKAIDTRLGKMLSRVSIDDNELRLDFTDGVRLLLWDGGQSCCESRYMTCDDDLSWYGGATLVSVETRDGGQGPTDYGDHDIEFLVVTTSSGFFTVANHNEHNGYYGGFYVEGRLDTAPQEPIVVIFEEGEETT